MNKKKLFKITLQTFQYQYRIKNRESLLLIESQERKKNP